MTFTGVVFFLLKWIEIIVLYLTGKALESTKTRKKYWRIAVTPIVVFALVEGLRWGRLIDWNNAVEEYDELDSFFNIINLSNPLYTIVLYLLKGLGFQYPFFVILQCGFLMFSSLFLLQDYKKYLRWILPCLLMAFVSNENFIRFYFSLSFVFIALYYYFHNILWKYILFSIIACLIHFSQIPFLLIFPFLKFLNKRSFPRLISILIYVVCLFFVDISQMDILVWASDYIVSLFGMESEYALLSRLNSMNDIINGTAYGTEGHLFTRSLANMISSALLYVPLIWMAPSCLKKEQYSNLIYNMTIINLILTAIFGQAELLQRIPLMFNIFVVITFAAVVFDNLQHKGLLLFIYTCLMLIIYFYPFLNAPFVREDYMMYFLWDSKGAATNFTPYLN